MSKTTVPTDVLYWEWQDYWGDTSDMEFDSADEAEADALENMIEQCQGEYSVYSMPVSIVGFNENREEVERLPRVLEYYKESNL